MSETRSARAGRSRLESRRRHCLQRLLGLYCWGSCDNVPSGMPPSVSPVPVPTAHGVRERALGILAAAAIGAVMYLARDVLVPITLAVILSLLVAPLVRMLRRFWLGHTLSVLT